MNCADTREVYLIQNGTRRLFGNGAVFKRMGYDFDDIRKIPKGDCDEQLYWVPEGETLW